MDDELERELRVSLRTTQAIVGCLAVGVLTFYVIVIVLSLTNALKIAAPRGVPLPEIGCGMAVVTVLLSFLVKGLVLSRARQDAKDLPDPIGVLLQRYRVANIMAGALCEGGAFAVGGFVLISGPGNLPWLCGGLISLLGFALHFPTREKMDAFLSESRS
jgi:hypothetical protein